MNTKILRDGIDGLNIQYKNEFDAKKFNPEYMKMLALRQTLPTYKEKDTILRTIELNKTVVISGETGCGKTTQVVQYILDDAIEKGKGSQVKIICTQPRRISTVAVAERVAAERVENMGESVGYQIRLRKLPPRDYGSIFFCTTGILLQFMLDDPTLKDYSHVFLDEIHERTVECDFIMGLLKQLIVKRPELKIVMMSATLDAPSFSKYYNNCPTISIPGFTYPVRVYYSEDVVRLIGCGSCGDMLDLDMIIKLLRYICTHKNPGAILIFLPGLQDIKKMKQELHNLEFFSAQKYQIFSLHSQFGIDKQKRIFEIPPAGVRKIIIATSIAETSVTIEDVVYVIDSGKIKTVRFDMDLNLKMLVSEWESRANAKQRRGRAGRIKPGECYHLFSRERERLLPEFITPEMKRTSLDEITLQIKMLELGRAEYFLKSLLDPPESRAIHLSLELLRSRSIIDSSADREELTPLGKHLGRLPLDLKSGKMILLASIFSCIEPVFAIAAGLSFENPFYSPIDDETNALAKKLGYGKNQYSDHVAIANVVEEYEKLIHFHEKEWFCDVNYVRLDTLEGIVDLKRQWAEYLHAMNFLSSDDPKDPAANRNSSNVALVKAIVCAGLFPNIARIEYKHSIQHGQYPIFKTFEDGEVNVFPPTVNGKIYNPAKKSEVKKLPTSHVAYFSKQKTSRIFLHDTTCVTQASMIFSLPKNSISTDISSIALNQRYVFFSLTGVESSILKSIYAMNELLEQKFNNPDTIKWHGEEGRILNVVIDYITRADPVA